jgi:hypothetical protein
MRIPAFITSRDLMSAVDLAEKLRACKSIGSVCIIDCDSTYRPLLEAYSRLSGGISVFYGPNNGCRAYWERFQGIASQPYYLVTDGDLDINHWSGDEVSIMLDRLRSQPQLIKVGSALQLSDLPETELARKAAAHENQFWQHRTADGFFAADIDTTLAIYRTPDWHGYYPAERCTLAMARHLPWYLDVHDLPDDHKHYLSRADHQAGTHWSGMLRCNLN